MQKVNSSVISEVGFSGGVLTVKFTSGMLYQYKKVPRQSYEKLLKADSIGTYFNKEIRPKFPGVLQK